MGCTGALLTDTFILVLILRKTLGLLITITIISGRYEQPHVLDFGTHKAIHLPQLTTFMPAFIKLRTDL